MTKREFLNALSLRLSNLPKCEAEKSTQYYDEIIVDRIEDGMNEEEAVEALGSMDSIVEGIMYDMPIQTLIKARVNGSKNNSTNKWVWITLAIIGFPIWFSLLTAFASVVLSIYISIWAVIISLYATVFAFGVSCVAGIIGGIILCFVKTVPAGICTIGIAIICGAITLFMIKPMFMITKWLASFTAIIAKKIKSLFIMREGN